MANYVSNFNVLGETINVKDQNCQNDVDIIKKIILSIDFFEKETNDNSDSERIQRGINYLHSNGGGILFFPAGNYDIGQTVLIYDNISLIGISNTATSFSVNGNYSFIQSYDKTSRHDNIEIANIKIIRNGTNINTPLIDFSNCSYSKLSNINCVQNNSQENSAGCCGLYLGEFSYYNLIENCQFRYFHTGIKCENSANGNIFLGGSCISCGVYGVHIVSTNSQRFYGHNVENGTNVIAYFLEHKSVYNFFYGCRIENVAYSYKAVYESNNQTSINNMVIGGLDYSINGAIFTDISNLIVNVDYLKAIENGTNVPSFFAYKNQSQGFIESQTLTKLIFETIEQNYKNTWNENIMTCIKNGIYNLCTQIVVDRNVGDVYFSIYKNGSEYITYKASQLDNNIYYITFPPIYLSSNDTIEIYTKFTNSGGNITSSLKSYISCTLN